MRKIIGFIFFVISSLIIAAVVIGNIEIFKDAFSDLESEDFLTEEFLLQIGVITAIVWQLLYQPIVVLLLSVIAMGKYSK